MTPVADMFLTQLGTWDDRRSGRNEDHPYDQSKAAGAVGDNWEEKKSNRCRHESMRARKSQACMRLGLGEVNVRRIVKSHRKERNKLMPSPPPRSA